MPLDSATVPAAVFSANFRKYFATAGYAAGRLSGKRSKSEDLPVVNNLSFRGIKAKMYLLFLFGLLAANHLFNFLNYLLL